MITKPLSGFTSIEETYAYNLYLTRIVFSYSKTIVVPIHNTDRDVLILIDDIKLDSSHLCLIVWVINTGLILRFYKVVSLHYNIIMLSVHGKIP